MNLSIPRLHSTIPFLITVFFCSAIILGLLHLYLPHLPILDVSMLWITNVVYYIFIGFFLLFLTFERTSLSLDDKLVLWLSFLLSIIASESLKPLIAEARPTGLHLTQEFSFSFPSTHTASMYALLPLLYSKKHISISIFVLIAITVAFSRLYVGVHFYHDVLGGMLVGLGIGYIFLHLKKVFHIPDAITTRLKEDKEIRRQIAHLLFGLGLVFLVGEHLLSLSMLGIILILGTTCILCIKYFGSLPIIFPILTFFEREHHISTFPGRGIFYFVLGSFLSLLFFPIHIAQAAILVLAFGDSITNVAGKYLGKIKLPYNSKKCIEGPILASIFASIAASFYVPFPQALLATSIAMFVETLPLYFGKIEIDDNLTIPLVASIVLLLTL